jgi:hypothetical protein
MPTFLPKLNLSDAAAGFTSNSKSKESPAKDILNGCSACCGALSREIAGAGEPLKKKLIPVGVVLLESHTTTRVWMQ